MKNTIISVAFLLISLVSKAQMSDSVQTMLKKEYMPFEKVSFNNKKILMNIDLKKIQIKYKSIMTTECPEPDECVTFEKFYITNATYFISCEYPDNDKRVACAFKIFDNSLTFDYYRKMYVGGNMEALKGYFPYTYKYIFEDFLKKNPKAKSYLFVIDVESTKGAYPNGMGYMTMGIDIDLKIKKIKSFEFFDQDQ